MCLGIDAIYFEILCDDAPMRLTVDRRVKLDLCIFDKNIS